MPTFMSIVCDTFLRKVPVKFSVLDPTKIGSLVWLVATFGVIPKTIFNVFLCIMPENKSIYDGYTP